ncbi:FG-GAP-like repeat-containing protein [Streptomyces violascens]|uniref:FG-GAP-like repeat-containing protein n=1 Tax=Streptomyces violascens TaxID=67381 RepID=UPI00366519E7
MRLKRIAFSAFAVVMFSMANGTNATAAESAPILKAKSFLVDSDKSDARPVQLPKQEEPPKTLAERRLETQPETPAQAEYRRQYVASQKAKSLIRSAPTPGFCQNVKDSAVHGPTGVFLDHWNWCRDARVAVVFQECVNGDCKTVGNVNWRLTSWGLGVQGNSPATRRIDFHSWLDDAKVYGKVDLSRIVKLSVNCSPYGQATCVPGPGNDREDTVQHWLEATYSGSSFTSPATGTDRDKVSFYDFQFFIQVEGPNGDIVPTPVTEPEGFRCDSAPYMENANGCVFDHVIERWTLRSDSTVKETANHIWTAQHSPDLTLPGGTGKRIPGAVESGTPLTRAAGQKTVPGQGSTIAANRAKSIAACKKYWGQRYSTQPGGPWDCDEYPSASTYEGAWSGSTDPEHKATKHFSVRVLPSADNQTAGTRQGRFYEDQRVIDHDRFYVKVTDSAGNDPQFPPLAPPPASVETRNGDLNGDGNPDLVAISKDGKLLFYPGRGDGSLGAVVQIGSGGWSGAAIAHGGDFNGDGKEDLVARIGSELRIYPGNGDGTLGNSVVFKGYGANWDSSITNIVTTVDSTGDGYPDIIASWGGGLWLYAGDPTSKPGIKAPVQIGGGGWGNYTLVSVGDADADGQNDLIARANGAGSGFLSLYRGPLNHDLSAHSTFAASGWDSTSRPLITSAVDADGDGFPDLWSTTSDGKLFFTKGAYDGDLPVAGTSVQVGSGGWNTMQAIG